MTQNGMDSNTREKGIDTLETFELVDELKKRQGVDTVMAEPYENKVLNVEGPAVVLIIVD